MENATPHPSQNSPEGNSNPQPNGDIMAYHGNEMVVLYQQAILFWRIPIIIL